MERRMLVLTHLFGQLSSRTDRVLFKHTLTFGPTWHSNFLWLCCFSPTGVGAMTWSPLACGIISGKYGNGVPESSRASLKVFSSTFRKVSGRAEGRRMGEKGQSCGPGLPSLSCSLGLWQGPSACPGLCCWRQISQPFIIENLSLRTDRKVASDLQTQIPTFWPILILKEVFHSLSRSDKI